jgi:hypothetical protein
MAIDYSGLISEAGRAALSSVINMPPDQRKAKMNDMLANGLLPFSVALAVDRQLTSPMKENAPSPRPGSVMSDKMAMLQNTGTGIDQLPVPSMDQAEFAGGGIVAFDDGGATDKPDMFSTMAAASPTHKRHGLWQFWKGLSGEEPPSEEEIRRKGQAERTAAGVGNAASKYQTLLQERQAGLDASSEEDRKAARKAGWLALAQAGLEGKGLIEGGVRGLAKNAEVMEAKNKERKAELRELQKEQYTLELAMEQAKMAGNKQDYDRYAAEREANLARQKMVAGGVQSMFELESQEERARLDRATQAQKDSINLDFFNRRKALQARLSGATPAEAERIRAQIDALDADWDKVNRNVGAASGYRADVGAENARAANLVKLMSSDVYVRAEAEANTALAAYNDPRVSGEKKKLLLDQYLAAQARLKQMRESVTSVGSEEEPTGTPSAEAGLAGAGAPRAPNSKFIGP